LGQCGEQVGLQGLAASSSSESGEQIKLIISVAYRRVIQKVYLKNTKITFFLHPLSCKRNVAMFVEAFDGWFF
jgi:hypothetical protein